MFKSIIAALVLSVALAACATNTTNFVTLERFEQLHRKVTGMKERQDLLHEKQLRMEIRQLVSQPDIQTGCWYEYKDGQLLLMGLDPDAQNIRVASSEEHDGGYCLYRWYTWKKDEDGSVVFVQMMTLDKGAHPEFGCHTQK